HSTQKEEMSVSEENANIRDHHRRLLAAKYELRRNLYKALCKDPSLPSDLREENRFKLSKLPRNSSFTRVRNRCIFSGRARAVYETFRMSRIVFRTLASKGMLNGIKKASWWLMILQNSSFFQTNNITMQKYVKARPVRKGVDFLSKLEAI
ncbi:mitochondrial ribosomal protein S14, partial [Prunus dulcis]